ncbi:S-layer homology domain-containing protein [Solibacillus sp. CAU 1738]|uniref:S-layer homology domain-containing protein n=1 Tax=Solibacillus sp. CAU 1738 TaxID=3140363 RepID=UPI00326096D2
MIKKIISICIVMIFALTISTQSVSYASDIEGHQMVNELTYWANLGVILPDSKGNYNPNRPVTRGEFAAYITRALNLPASDKYQFSDLKANNPITLEIQAAAGSGILSGYPDGTFKPNEKITRQHMAAMLYKALRYLNVPLEVAPLTFTDNNKISKQFHNAVSTSVYYNIIRGSHEKNGVFFKPQGSATIAHAAAFLFRMNSVAQQFGQDGSDTEPEPPTTPPTVDTNSYYVGSISGSTVKKQPTVYLTYEQAEAAFNASKSVNLIFKGDKIIKMNAGIASAADVQANTVTIYGNKNFTNALTYVVEGSEFNYIGSNDTYAIVQVADTKGYVKTTEVTLTPTELIKGREYYYVAGGYLTHKTYNHIKQAYNGDYVVGEAPSFMSAGVHYYSQDGVNFYNENGKLVGTHYPYFQFASIRQPSNYTADELNAIINALLEERLATGHARYANILTESRLLGLGTFLKEVEATHHVNALFILATAMHESDYGISKNSLEKNNIFGIKVYDSDETLGSTYDTPNDSILAFINQYVNKNYVPQTGGFAKGASPGNKTAGMNVHYASDPYWGSKIAGHMYRMDNRFGRKDFGQARLAMVVNGGSSVNTRLEPTTSSALMFTYKAKVIGETGMFGYPVAIVDETTGDDGYVWYKVYSDANPPADYVWIRSDLVEVLPK